MNLKGRILTFVEKRLHPNRYCSEAYVSYLRRNGAKIGKNTFFYAPKSNMIDDRRLPYITIGEGCSITAGVQILCHDYSWSILRKSHNEILPDPGKPVTIGDNVFLGWNVVVLGGVTIGSNVIVGANSVVTKDIPGNSVCAGNPARVISSLDSYFAKKKERQTDDAILRAKYVYQQNKRLPTMTDMAWFNVLWLDRNAESEAFLRQLPFRGDDMDQVIQTFYHTKKQFENFDAFIRTAFEKN